MASLPTRNVVQYGGYDYDFVEEVPEQLVCSTICTKVLCDPHLTACCGQHFCNSCLEHWFKRQGKQVCPHCRKEDFTHIPDKPVKRRIDQLKVRCTNHKAGCEWVGELSTVQTHLDSGCGDVEVSCTNKCRKGRGRITLKRKDLARHLEQQCPLRRYQCKHCGKEDTYHTITTTHYNECPNYPLDCPNKCGTMGIKRAEMDQHRSKCPLEPVECPFKETGCQVKVVRKEFESHMEISQQQHLLTLMGAFRVAKADLEVAKADLEAIKEEKADLEAVKGVIATDVKIVRQSRRKEQSDLALASIESQLEMKSFRLTRRGPPLTIRMTNFSHYKQSGKVWYSPPFYYGAGYKMQLAVYANGTGAGAGTHMSIVLLRMKGEYDDQLEWTEDSNRCIMHIKIVVQKPDLDQKIQAKADFSLDIYKPERVSGVDVREEGRNETFCDLRTMRETNFLNDSIVLQVSQRVDILSDAYAKIAQMFKV